jgi:trimethylamine--corrinoid protein Co-methyltransferase
MSALSGADLVHDIGLMDHCTLISPELIVFTDEIIGMIGQIMRGVDINDETLALDLVDRVGPGGNFLAEDHTLQHFRSHWVPSVMDRTQLTLDENGHETMHCEELLNRKTLDIIDTHRPEPLPEDTIRELKDLEKSWFDEFGMKYEYPQL